MTEDRFVDIETRIAHQDQLLHELNDALTKQQDAIMRLERLCDSIVERLRAMAESMPAAGAGDERPPHY